MLREMPAEKFFEWQTYSQLRPFGTGAEDARIALLAEVIVGALGAKTRTGPYTAAAFLRSLGRKVPMPEVKRQSVAEMTRNLNAMFAGVNAVFAERGGMSER